MGFIVMFPYVHVTCFDHICLPVHPLALLSLLDSSASFPSNSPSSAFRPSICGWPLLLGVPGFGAPGQAFKPGPRSVYPWPTPGSEMTVQGVRASLAAGGPALTLRTPTREAPAGTDAHSVVPRQALPLGSVFLFCLVAVTRLDLISSAA